MTVKSSYNVQLNVWQLYEMGKPLDLFGVNLRPSAANGGNTLV